MPAFLGRPNTAKGAGAGWNAKMWWLRRSVAALVMAARRQAAGPGEGAAVGNGGHSPRVEQAHAARRAEELAVEVNPVAGVPGAQSIEEALVRRRGHRRVARDPVGGERCRAIEEALGVHSSATRPAHEDFSSAKPVFASEHSFRAHLLCGTPFGQDLHPTPMPTAGHGWACSRPASSSANVPRAARWAARARVRRFARYETPRRLLGRADGPM